MSYPPNCSVEGGEGQPPREPPCEHSCYEFEVTSMQS